MSDCEHYEMNWFTLCALKAVIVLSL